MTCVVHKKPVQFIWISIQIQTEIRSGIQIDSLNWSYWYLHDLKIIDNNIIKTLTMI